MSWLQHSAESVAGDWQAPCTPQPPTSREAPHTMKTLNKPLKNPKSRLHPDEVRYRRAPRRARAIPAPDARLPRLVAAAQAGVGWTSARLRACMRWARGTGGRLATAARRALRCRPSHLTATKPPALNCCTARGLPTSEGSSRRSTWRPGLEQAGWLGAWRAAGLAPAPALAKDRPLAWLFSTAGLAAAPCSRPAPASAGCYDITHCNIEGVNVGMDDHPSSAAASAARWRGLAAAHRCWLRCRRRPGRRARCLLLPPRAAAACSGVQAGGGRAALAATLTSLPAS